MKSVNKNRVLIGTKIKLNLTNILFFLLNIFHIILASTSTIDVRDTGILRYQISFFSSFNYQEFILASVLLVLQFIISYIILFRRFRKSNLAQINELGLVGDNNEEIRKNLRLDPKLIYQWVVEEAEKYKIKSIKRVYLTNTSIPNALTIDIVPLPLIRSSWIVLDANVIEILDEREIKAVIAHELGHVKRLDSLVNIFRYGVNYFVFIAYSFVFLEMLDKLIIYRPADGTTPLTITLRVGFVLIFILILIGFTIINRLIMNLSRRQAELMADYYAAKKIGKNHIINALILLGQRIDVITAFGTEFKWLGKRENKTDVTREFLQGIKDLPPEELSKEISRKKALEIYVHQRLKNLKEDLFVPITDEEITKLADEACAKLLGKREEEIEKGLIKDRKLASELQKLTIDWLTLDKDQDQYLKDEEIDQLIKTIISNPSKELFESDLYQRRTALLKDHPSMKDRILFVYYSS
ncbi:MAG: M48 family metalloprotease [Asgard group archaeon]|nr:M48 family metalloprotease [Asgard group archaeon]